MSNVDSPRIHLPVPSAAAPRPQMSAAKLALLERRLDCWRRGLAAGAAR